MSLCAVRLMPRSKLLTDRGHTPAAAASSSCVSFAAARNCRSSSAKENASCSATASASPRIRPASTLNQQYASPFGSAISLRPGQRGRSHPLWGAA